MHAFDVNFQLLRLAKFSSTKVTQWSGSLRVGSTAIRAMHVQVVEAKEKLQSDNPGLNWEIFFPTFIVSYFLFVFCFRNVIN